MSDERFKSIIRQRLEAEGYGPHPANVMVFLRAMPCSCRGEVHDECREELEEGDE